MTSYFLVTTYSMYTYVYPLVHIWVYLYIYIYIYIHIIGSLPESLTRGLSAGKRLVGGLGVYIPWSSRPLLVNFGDILLVNFGDILWHDILVNFWWTSGEIRRRFIYCIYVSFCSFFKINIYIYIYTYILSMCFYISLGHPGLTWYTITWHTNIQYNIP